MVSLRVLTLVSVYQLMATLLAAVATLLLAPRLGVAALAGGLLIAANFWVMRFVATRALGGERPKLGLLLLLGFKLAAVLGLLALFILVFRLDPLGLALGLATLFVGVGFATVHAALTPRAAGAPQSSN